MSAPSSSPSTALHNVEIEAGCIATILQYPDTYGDFYLIDQGDFSETHRPLWQVLVQQLTQSPPASVAPMVLADKLKGYGAVLQGFEPYDYLEALRIKFVQRTDAPGMARELKRLSTRRDLIGKMDTARRELVGKPDATFEDMTKMVEKGLTSVQTEYYKPEVTEVMGGMIEVIEARAAKPLTAEDAGFLGPFPSINSTIGSICYPSAYVVIGARSASGKSSLGWFYQTYLLEKYPQTHLLHLDAAEMPYEELCWRAVCCMSEGRIPYWAIYRGEWAKNPAWAKLIRNELWPRAQKMVGRMSYKNIGMMSPQEQISFIRRYYFNKVGRGNHLLLHYDYLKGMESFNKTSEYQAIGNFVNAQKALITEEITASIWTSVQNNRMGIVNGKKVSDVNDSEEAFSLSDRILQMSTHSFSMRFKLPEELAAEMNLFGSIRLSPLKKRQLLGERFQEMITPLKLENGKFANNYFNLDSKAFWYSDKGSLKHMLEVLGKGQVKMDSDGAKVMAL